jgi:hypothetical protein
MFKYISMDIEYCGFNNPRGICQNIILQDFSTHEFYIELKILNFKRFLGNYHCLHFILHIASQGNVIS